MEYSSFDAKQGCQVGSCRALAYRALPGCFRKLKTREHFARLQTASLRLRVVTKFHRVALCCCCVTETGRRSPMDCCRCVMGRGVTVLVPSPNVMRAWQRSSDPTSSASRRFKCMQPSARQLSRTFSRRDTTQGQEHHACGSTRSASRKRELRVRDHPKTKWPFIRGCDLKQVETNNQSTRLQAVGTTGGRALANQTAKLCFQLSRAVTSTLGGCSGCCSPTGGWVGLPEVTVPFAVRTPEYSNSVLRNRLLRGSKLQGGAADSTSLRSP